MEIEIKAKFEDKNSIKRALKLLKAEENDWRGIN